MSTVASLKAAPAYSLQSAERWTALDCRAEQKIETQLFNFSPCGSCVRMRSLHEFFMTAASRTTVQTSADKYVFADARQLLAVALQGCRRSVDYKRWGMGHV